MANALKHVYDRAYVDALSDQVRGVFPAFPSEDFKVEVLDDGWEQRELRARTRHLSLCMGAALPGDYHQALSVLEAIAHLPRPSSYPVLADMWFPDFVEVHGLDELERSLAALEVFTPFSSSEFAIRPFLRAYPEVGMRQMLAWARHPNEHVRRLASEGCRPRLPWGGVLKSFVADPGPIFPILQALKADPSLYVRKSVANNLNDISKDHPEQVLDLGKRWMGRCAETDWIVKHACRTLLKQGHPQALALFGFEPDVAVELKALRLSPCPLPWEGQLRMQGELHHRGSTATRLRLEYAIYYLKANGRHHRKVFQLSESTLAPGELRKLDRKQSFREMSTRKHYPGLHRWALVINGQEGEAHEFELLPPSS